MYKIGILSPGKMGGSLALSLAEKHEIYCALDGRSKETIDRAERLGLKNLRTLNQIFSVCDVVFCIGTAGTAFDTIQSALDNCYGGVYVDFNTLFGEESEQQLLDKSKNLDFVDGILYGWPVEEKSHENKERKMYLSGPKAQNIADLFNKDIWKIYFTDKSPKKYRRLNLS
jgi:3-hydroxyisobutyrate dehydrogenase-like beta-hydroxyacid dehydrogenase